MVTIYVACANYVVFTPTADLTGGVLYAVENKNVRKIIETAKSC